MELYIFLLLILSVTLLAIDIFLYSKRDIPGTKPFIACISLIAVWNFMDAVDVMIYNLDTKSLWFSIKMAVIVYIPALWLMIVLEMTNKRSFRSRRNILLMIFPTITAIIILANYNSNWFAYNYYIESVGRYNVLNFSKGFWFWANACYNYLLNALSLILLIKCAASKQYVQRRQAIVMIIGMLVPIFNDILVVGLAGSMLKMDITPVSFWVSTIIYVYAVYKYGLMNIVIVARESAFENMDELMIVLDINKRVVDMNKASLDFFGKEMKSIVGMPVYDIIEDAKFYNFDCLIDNSLKIKFNSKMQGNDVNYYGSVSAVKGNNGSTIGYLLMLYDMTALTITQKELAAANDELLRLNQELYNDSIRDGLTKVFNKKNITIMLQEFIEQAKDKNMPFSLALFDIDHFKMINDTYGHLIGDDVLQKVARLLNDLAGSESRVGRFGGEEFLMLMKDTDLEACLAICDKIRREIEECRFKEHKISITISAGVTAMRKGDTLNSLIKRVDDCMYRAKESGRNRIEISA